MGKSILGAAVCLLALIAVTTAQNAKSDDKTGRAELVSHGKYLVENVAGCNDCHTPMNERGEPVKEKYLGGATLFFKPIAPIPGWADASPKIAGLPGWTDEQAMTFFTTGIGPHGETPAPPMPRFRFNQQDAAAVIAYLRSLDTTAQAAEKK